MNEDRLETIRRYGKKGRGHSEMIRHLEGKRLTLKQAVHAHCYDCCGFYADGKVDCLMLHCSLHPFMPYNEDREKKSTRIISKEHMERMREARRQKSTLTL